MSSNQEVLLFRMKFEEKRKFFAKAEADYNVLYNRVDKLHSELAGLRMERFKVECLAQELNIRVDVYEQREKELKDENERKMKSTEKAKNQLAEELEVRDSFNREFSRKVINMATEFRQYKDSCIKSNVSDSLQILKQSDVSLTSEIQSKLQSLCLSSTDSGEHPDEDTSDKLLHRMFMPATTPQCETLDIREEEDLLRAELVQMKTENAKLAANVDQLMKRKGSLLELCDGLKTRLSALGEE